MHTSSIYPHLITYAVMSEIKPSTTGYFKLTGKFTVAEASHDFTRTCSNLPATLGRSTVRSTEPGYIHIGDCKSISKNNATISYDTQRCLFLLTVLGKNKVIVNGKSFTKDDEPVVLVNKTAVRMGSQQNSNSKFYFLLPLEQPKESVAKLCMEVAKELIRAGQENEITGRLVTEQLKLKYPFYAAEDQSKGITRKVTGYLKRQASFERRDSTEELIQKYGKKVVVYRWNEDVSKIGKGKKRTLSTTSEDGEDGEGSSKRARLEL